MEGEMRFILTTVAACVLGLSSTTVYAQSTNGAAVVKEFGCILTSAASGLDIDLLTNETTHAVNTPNGKSLVKCHFDIPVGHEPKKAIVNEGFDCNTFLGVTTKSQSVCSPGGHCDLTCQLK
jgi:hypothetical protein